MASKKKALQDKVAVIHDVLSEYGYITESSQDDPAGAVNHSYQNINLLLKNYRLLDAVREDLRLNLKREQESIRFDSNYYQKRFETIDNQLGRIDFALSRIPFLVSPHGSVAYDALKKTYFDKEKKSVTEICKDIYNPLCDEMGISTTMYYSYLDKGKTVLSTILFNVGEKSAELWMDMMVLLEELAPLI